MVRTVDELRAALVAVAEGRPHAQVQVGSARAQADAPVFVFSGQGGQWSAMGRALLAEEPVFAAVVERCAAAFAALGEVEVMAALRGEAALERGDVVQPAQFAVCLGLVAVWQALGVEPAAVIGHSLGEVAAAVTAGALSVEAGARIVLERARRLLACDGGVAAIELGVEEVERRICLLYTSPSPRDRTRSRMPSSA